MNLLPPGFDRRAFQPVILSTILCATWTLHEDDRENQEGEVNTSDWADPMIMAIMTSRRKMLANAENFRKWRRYL